MLERRANGGEFLVAESVFVMVGADSVELRDARSI
jgi:hypothetical protein